jgi:hypothetical protein
VVIARRSPLWNWVAIDESTVTGGGKGESPVLWLEVGRDKYHVLVLEALFVAPGQGESPVPGGQG